MNQKNPSRLQNLSITPEAAEHLMDSPGSLISALSLWSMGSASSKSKEVGQSSQDDGASTISLGGKLQSISIEKGILDRLDKAVIKALSDRSGATNDMALNLVVACLLTTVKSGGLRIPIDPLPLSLRLATFLNELDPPTAENSLGQGEGLAAISSLALSLAQHFDTHRKSGAYTSILGSPSEYLPLIHWGNGLYFQKHFAAEASAGTRLFELLSALDSPNDTSNLRTILDTVLNRLPLRIGNTPDSPKMEFDQRQQEALAMALRKRFVVISGGPGTGKTSLAANLLRGWTRAWTKAWAEGLGGMKKPDANGPLPRIRLAAPTGRAAQRLAESLQRSLKSIRPEETTKAAHEDTTIDHFVRDLPCQTLHALLRYNPGSGDFFHRRSRPIPADLVVVDEVSMVDIFTMSRLLEALEDHACLVLIGDMDQLPSVEAGSVLADLVPNEGVSDHPLKHNLVVLDRSHRSQASILAVTRKINVMDGKSALKGMRRPAHLPTFSWPVAFVENGTKVVPGGGCHLLLPTAATQSSSINSPAATIIPPSDYRAGWPAWLDSWIDFHFLNHSLDPQQFPGRTLATPRSAAYETLIHRLSTYRLPQDAVFNLSFSQKNPEFLSWLTALTEVFAYLDQARILTFTRNGWYGSVYVNQRIRERLIRRWDPRSPLSSQARGNDGRAGESRGAEGFNGAPILILENDHAKNLFNGDVGVFLRVQGRAMAFFRRSDSFLAFPAAFLPRHEIAFATTIHKSQGSEYDQALVVLPEAGNRLLYKETLYTALTRARFFAGIYGAQEVFLEAVGRKVWRDSGLQDYLSPTRRN